MGPGSHYILFRMEMHTSVQKVKINSTTTAKDLMKTLEEMWCMVFTFNLTVVNFEFDLIVVKNKHANTAV